MKTHKKAADKAGIHFPRRDFIRGASLATVASMMGGIPLVAADAQPAGTEKKPAGPPLNCGIIGLGLQGRELLRSLSKLSNAPVVALCDKVRKLVDRAKELAPQAEGHANYQELLANKNVQAVLVATPTPTHREIVEAALSAGKHVYCEVPLAHTIEDARAIALAARKAIRCNFQAGLQRRADVQYHFVLKFLRSGAGGNIFKARSQWAKKTSWRRASADPEREKELNWRLYSASSLGLVGEIGIHQLDTVCWFLKKRPKAVTGFGAVLVYNQDDDRDVADTVQAVFEFPGKINYLFDATLGSSFESEYDVIYGTDGSFLFRGSQAWLFKEADAPALGWEVYGLKDDKVVYKEMGYVLRSDATQIATQGKKIANEPLVLVPALDQSVENFVFNSNLVRTGVKDFEEAFDPKNESGLREYLDGLQKHRKHAASAVEGFEATVLAVKANEAVQKGARIMFADEWFQL